MIDYKFSHAIGILHIPEKDFRLKMDELFSPEMNEDEKEERLKFLLWQKDARRKNYDFCFPDHDNTTRDMADNEEISFSGLCKEVAGFNYAQWNDYVESGAIKPLDEISRFKAKRFHGELSSSEAAKIVEEIIKPKKREPEDKAAYIQNMLDIMTLAEWRKTENSIEYRKTLPENDGSYVSELDMITLGIMVSNNDSNGITELIQKYDEETRVAIYETYADEWNLKDNEKSMLLRAFQIKPTLVSGKGTNADTDTEPE